jgi:3-dehydroquinate dehydratase-1
VPRNDICAVLVENDPASATRVAGMVSLFEVRLDLIGDGWRELLPHLKKPWIATNRARRNGGGFNGSEAARLERLFKALDAGAAMVDIELETENLAQAAARIKEKALCLVSYHNFEATPLYPELTAILEQERRAGADVCKIVTTAQSLGDNFRLLKLIRDFPQIRIVAFAMGESGILSRVLCPLVGGDFTYASVSPGRESAPGQLTIAELRNIYGMVQKC